MLCVDHDRVANQTKAKRKGAKMELKERIKQTAIVSLSFFLFLCLLIIFGGCARVDGETEHKVSGDATIHVVVEFPLCESIEDPQSKQACIETLLDALNSKNESVDQPENITGAP